MKVRHQAWLANCPTPPLNISQRVFSPRWISSKLESAQISSALNISLSKYELTSRTVLWCTLRLVPLSKILLSGKICQGTFWKHLLNYYDNLLLSSCGLLARKRTSVNGTGFIVFSISVSFSVRMRVSVALVSSLLVLTSASQDFAEYSAGIINRINSMNTTWKVASRLHFKFGFLSSSHSV